MSSNRIGGSALRHHLPYVIAAAIAVGTGCTSTGQPTTAAARAALTLPPATTAPATTTSTVAVTSPPTTTSPATTTSTTTATVADDPGCTVVAQLIVADGAARTLGTAAAQLDAVSAAVDAARSSLATVPATTRSVAES